MIACILACQFVLILSKSGNFKADPSCETGIIKSDVCCKLECKTCGGENCSKLPGGSKSCCVDDIRNERRYCMNDDPPCILSPNPPSPNLNNVSSFNVDLNSLVATVSPEYVSFTIDSGSVYSLDLSGNNSNNMY